MAAKAPSTTAEALAFCRREDLGITSAVRLREDFDLLEIKVKGLSDAGEVTWRLLTELSIFSAEARETALLAAAHAAWEFLQTVELED